MLNWSVPPPLLLPLESQQAPWGKGGGGSGTGILIPLIFFEFSYPYLLSEKLFSVSYLRIESIFKEKELYK